MKPTAVSLVVAVLAVSAAALAQAPAPPMAEPQLPPQYEVEILVFQNLNFDPTEERFRGDSERLRRRCGGIARSARIRRHELRAVGQPRVAVRCRPWTR